jgi:hypothetical protein
MLKGISIVCWPYLVDSNLLFVFPFRPTSFVLYASSPLTLHAELARRAIAFRLVEAQAGGERGAEGMEEMVGRINASGIM